MEKVLFSPSLPASKWSLGLDECHVPNVAGTGLLLTLYIMVSKPDLDVVVYNLTMSITSPAHAMQGDHQPGGRRTNIVRITSYNQCGSDGRCDVQQRHRKLEAVSGGKVSGTKLFSQAPPE